jgi:pimeloyl-ACP methyl ester carboxylesterase
MAVTCRLPHGLLAQNRARDGRVDDSRSRQAGDVAPARYSPAMSVANSAYIPKRACTCRLVEARGFKHHVRIWGDERAVRPERPAFVLLHGFMDVGASFQFLVDALAALEGEARTIVAPDLRGFGHTLSPPTDAYWFPDYLGDLDALLDALLPDQPIDLLGHSMGGNVSMMYAGVRPSRVRKLVNLEGFGLPDTRPEEAPGRLAQWLDQLKVPQTLRSFPSLEAVAERLRRNNPLLAPARAAYLAAHWAEARDGAFHILGDPAHKRVNPILFREAEALAFYRNITAPVLWVEGSESRPELLWGKRYSKAKFHERLSVVRQVERKILPNAGHMLHHDQPEALAALIAPFLG